VNAFFTGTVIAVGCGKFMGFLFALRHCSLR
jgi:hypothetical protein